MKPLAIVIISMNNPADLIDCVNSIENFNPTAKYDIHVIAFNYSEDNLKQVKELKCSIHEHTGVKGFSENYNLVLRKLYAIYQYCLVLNDDTYFIDDSVSKMLEICLVEKFKIISPVILNTDSSIQFLGRPKLNLFTYLLFEFKLDRWGYSGDTNKNIFKTFNISGACFMIEFNHFRDLGFFDSDYFFTPEDIALSTKSYKAGVYPYVAKECKVYHKESATTKSIHQITFPVGHQGMYLFFRKFYGKHSEFLVRSLTLIFSAAKYLIWFFMKNSQQKNTMQLAHYNIMRFSFVKIQPKTLFMNLYSRL